MTPEVYASWAFVSTLRSGSRSHHNLEVQKASLDRFSRNRREYAKPLLKTTVPESWEASTFVLRRKYRSIDDRTLNRLGDSTCNLFWTMLALFGVFVAFFILAVQGN